MITNRRQLLLGAAAVGVVAGLPLAACAPAATCAVGASLRRADEASKRRVASITAGWRDRRKGLI